MSDFRLYTLIYRLERAGLHPGGGIAVRTAADASRSFVQIQPETGCSHSEASFFDPEGGP